MASKTILAALLATSVAAQQSLLTLPFYGYDPQPIVASVVAVASSITTLQLACAPGTDGSECGLAIHQTLTVGPSTYNMYLSEDENFVMTQDCNTADNVCMQSASGSEANSPGSSTTTYEASDVETFTITVTAGENLLSAGAGASSTGPASTIATATGTGTTSGSIILVSGTAMNTETSSTGTGTADASTSTGGAVAKAVGEQVLMAAGAGLGLMGLML